MFDQVRIINYRGVQKLEISDFANINLFIGDNNTGKSTALESIFYLINPGNARLLISTNSFREMPVASNEYWTTYFNQYNGQEVISIDGRLRTGEERGLKIELKMPSKEQMPQDDTSGNTLMFGHQDAKQTKAVGLVSHVYKKAAKNSKKIEWVTELTIDPNKGQLTWVSLRDEETNIGGYYLTGRNFTGGDAKRFDSIQISNRKYLKTIIKFLKTIEPGLEDLRLGSNGIILADIGADKMLPVPLLGDGFARILSIALAIGDSPDGVVIIDEIENGISYRILQEFWKYIFQHIYQNKVQIFASTHSLETIHALYQEGLKKKKYRPSIHVYRFDRTGNKHAVTKYDSISFQNTIEMGIEIR